MGTAIQWTDETWNPTVGCSRVSPGCDACYAINVAHRAMQPAHEGLTDLVYDESRPKGYRVDWTGEVRCLPDRLDTPLRWRKPRRVFVDSMSDLFHPDVPDEFIAQVWDVMVRTPQHTYQILTKRPQRMARALGPDGIGFYASNRADLPCPQPNVWLGTSVENQRYADLRIPHILATPAAVRFLSVEPLLGPVDLARWLFCGEQDGDYGKCNMPRGHDGRWHQEVRDGQVWAQWGGWRDEVPASRVDWVIVGGESGPSARPMHPDWVRDIRDQCIAAGVPFLFKQWGGRTPKAGGRELDGRTWDEYPPADR